MAPRKLKYISLFSGMEAATCAFQRAGIDAEPVAFSEIEPAACAVLAHRWPGVPNNGDVSRFDWSAYRGQVDVVLGGSPCMSFSVAGKRLGLDDPRGNLALEYLRVVAAVRPRWFVYENVPGLLSSGEGDDFAAFLETLGDIGYCASWRVLDAQNFGVPQRRRRLFLVGRAGDDWESPANVLAVADRSEGRPEETGWKDQAPASVAEGSPAEHGVDDVIAFSIRGRGGEPMVEVEPVPGVCPALSTCGDGSSHRFVAHADTYNGTVSLSSTQTLRAAVDGSGSHQGCAIYAADMRHGTISNTETMTLQAKGQGVSLNALPCAIMAFQQSQSGMRLSDTHATLDANNGSRRHNGVVAPADGLHWIARRLTPLECLRLQGFPDNWLDGVTLRGKPLTDSHRYRLIGNSWAVPVAAWVLRRLVDEDAKSFTPRNY